MPHEIMDYNKLIPLEQEIQRVKGEYTLDSAVIFSNSQEIRGTAEDSKYFVSIFPLGIYIILLMDETEYGARTSEPIKVAQIPLQMAGQNDFKINLFEILTILEWGCRDCNDYIPVF